MRRTLRKGETLEEMLSEELYYDHDLGKIGLRPLGFKTMYDKEKLSCFTDDNNKYYFFRPKYFWGNDVLDFKFSFEIITDGKQKDYKFKYNEKD